MEDGAREMQKSSFFRSLLTGSKRIETAHNARLQAALRLPYLNLFRLSEFVTTDTELSAIAAPAITGLRRPAAAKGMPTEL